MSRFTPPKNKVFKVILAVLVFSIIFGASTSVKAQNNFGNTPIQIGNASDKLETNKNHQGNSTNFNPTLEGEFPTENQNDKNQTNKTSSSISRKTANKTSTTATDLQGITGFFSPQNLGSKTDLNTDPTLGLLNKLWSKFKSFIRIAASSIKSGFGKLGSTLYNLINKTLGFLNHLLKETWRVLIYDPGSPKTSASGALVKLFQGTFGLIKTIYHAASNLGSEAKTTTIKISISLLTALVIVAISLRKKIKNAASTVKSKIAVVYSWLKSKFKSALSKTKKAITNIAKAFKNFATGTWDIKNVLIRAAAVVGAAVLLYSLAPSLVTYIVLYVLVGEVARYAIGKIYKKLPSVPKIDPALFAKNELNINEALKNPDITDGTRQELLELKELNHKNLSLYINHLASKDVYSNSEGDDSDRTAELAAVGFKKLNEQELRALGIEPETLQPQSGVAEGFKASIYRNPDTKEIIVSFRGTRMNSLKDWWIDVSNAAGEHDDAHYYTHAKNNIPKTIQALEAAFPDTQITTTGHSLGGGLATMISIITEKESTVFNAAGIDLKQLSKDDPTNALRITEMLDNGKITDYHLDRDILTILQGKILPIFIASNPGKKVKLTTPDFTKTMVTNHIMDTVSESVHNKINKDQEHINTTIHNSKTIITTFKSFDSASSQNYYTKFLVAK